MNEKQKRKMRMLNNTFTLLDNILQEKKSNKDFEIILLDEFRDILFETMWTFINPEVIIKFFDYMNKPLIINFKDDIEDDNWEDEKKGRNTISFRNSLCFKGNDDEGHYVFVDDNLEVYGTYEKDLLVNDNDDGICHGVAMIYAIGWNENRYPITIGTKPLNTGTKSSKEYIYKRTDQENLQNYRNILSFYLFLCESQHWKNAVNFYFGIETRPNEKDPWTEEKNNLAINTLNVYLAYLNSFNL